MSEQLPQSFQDKLRERILSQFVDLIPADKLNEMIQAEIKFFFETPDLLTVKPTQVEVLNPRYDPKDHGRWGNEPKIKIDCLAFGSHMTPFRQMVWTCLHEHLRPQFEAALNNSETELRAEINRWTEVIGKPKIVESTRSMVTDMGLAMSRTMLARTMEVAVSSAHTNMRNSLMQAGVNTNGISQTPVVFGEADLTG